MTDYDHEVKKWVADKLNVNPQHIASIEFENYISCYSSWTCDYGTTIEVTLTGGKRHVLDGWTFPQALQDFSEWMEAQERLSDDHADSHGWN